jgi:ubiquinone/menaquinone biosynthesis C-methylase UbiE
MRQPHQDNRQLKSEKIIAVLKDYLLGKGKSFICLDVGCGTGIISNHLAEYFSSVIAVDIEINSSETNASSLKSGRAIFTEASGEELPFPDTI